MSSLMDLIDLVREEEGLFGESGPCPVLVEPGTDPRLLLVTGANAGGKSLVCRFLDANSRDEGGQRVEFMRVGMGQRTESGMRRAMIFGDEERESTGRISSDAVVGGMETCRRRGTPHVLCLDEPDVGLSEEMQGGLGLALADFARGLPDLTLGLVVVTHSRHVARPLLGLGPWCMRVGDDRRPTAEWADSVPVPATADSFLGLAKASNVRMRAVKAVLDARRPQG